MQNREISAEGAFVWTVEAQYDLSRLGRAEAQFGATHGFDEGVVDEQLAAADCRLRPQERGASSQHRAPGKIFGVTFLKHDRNEAATVRLLASNKSIMRWTLLFVSSLAFAQLDKANLTGVVTDSSGGVVRGAAVRIEAPATGFSRVGETNETGAYILSHVPVGDYIVTFSKDGFQPSRFEKIVLRIGQTRALDATLQISTTASQIVVTDTPPALQTTNAEISLVFEQEQMRSLP
ncbi:MAG: carboxypeptidase regulatory-like domain-containing protein, partial [Acidobacteria bacterium]|nr:carboxypeptidase regulatory-like domain-containing protein [Acidobacteriota bacterium]